jgi:hypothetical protein
MSAAGRTVAPAASPCVVVALLIASGGSASTTGSVGRGPLGPSTLRGPWRRRPGGSHPGPTAGRTLPASARAAGAGHIRSLRERGIDARSSVGVTITENARQAILRATDWVPAVVADGQPRDGAEVCELTGLVDDTGYPRGTQFIVRRKTPHPGAQLSLFDTIAGKRHQVIAHRHPTRQRLGPVPGSPPPCSRPRRGQHPYGQRHPAPRGALLYPRQSREELGGRFLGLMAYLAPKG